MERLGSCHPSDHLRFLSRSPPRLPEALHLNHHFYSQNVLDMYDQLCEEMVQLVSQVTRLIYLKNLKVHFSSSPKSFHLNKEIRQDHRYNGHRADTRQLIIDDFKEVLQLNPPLTRCLPCHRRPVPPPPRHGTNTPLSPITIPYPLPPPASLRHPYPHFSRMLPTPSPSHTICLSSE